MTPNRIIDTRASGGPIHAGQTRTSTGLTDNDFVGYVDSPSTARTAKQKAFEGRVQEAGRRLVAG